MCESKGKDRGGEEAERSGGMFTLAGNFMRWMKKKNEKNLTILLLGLDNAGKSTLLFGLKGEQVDTVTPTIGFRPSTVVKGKYTIQWFDVGGAKNFRRVWQSYYSEVHGVIFVVDAADRERFEEAKETLAMTLESEGIGGKPVLVFANKQDLDGAADAKELSEQLGLLSRKQVRHNVSACTAKGAEGAPPDSRIGTALKWLLDAIDSDYTKLNDRVVAEKAERDRKEQERRAAQRKRAEESKALRLKEQAEAERLKREQEQQGQGAGGAMEAGLAHGNSDQAKPASSEAWVVGATQGPNSTPRPDGVTPMVAATPVRHAASLEGAETPGKDDAPPAADVPLETGKPRALEVGDSLTGLSSPSTKPRLQNLKPMPPPVAEITVPGAVASPVLKSSNADKENSVP